jgi:hypothetical protein
MEAKYFCEICDTKPDQFSHHKAHLQTQKHIKNCEHFTIEMKIFSMMFRQIMPRKWYESEYKDYIISKYKSDKNNKIVDIINYDEITEWIKSFNFTSKYNNWDNECFDNKPFPVCYKDETTIDWEQNNNDHKNWAINRILKYKETMQTKPRKITARYNNEARNKRELSKYTNISFNKIRDIRNGLIDLTYLTVPIQFLNPKEHDMEIYNDEIVKYSCLLFHKFGIHQLYVLYDGYAPFDIEEHPEEKKYNSFYFYKEVDIEHISQISTVNNYQVLSIEKKPSWVSCYMGDFMDYLDHIEKGYENNKIIYSYISNVDFKYFIKDSLIEIFSDRIKKIECEINYKKEETINFGWKKTNEKIIYDYTKKTGYLINNNEQPFWSNKESGIIGVSIGISDERRDISSCQKLTEEELKEYLKFKNDKDESLDKLNEELKYCEKEIVKIKELSLNSPIIKSITQICQYLFDYDEKLIYYYKTHMYIALANIEKEKMEKALMLEFEL